MATKMRRQSIDWEKIFAMIYLIKDGYSKYTKKILKLNNKKISN